MNHQDGDTLQVAWSPCSRLIAENVPATMDDLDDGGHDLVAASERDKAGLSKIQAL